MFPILAMLPILMQGDDGGDDGGGDDGDGGSYGYYGDGSGSVNCDASCGVALGCACCAWFMDTAINS